MKLLSISHIKKIAIIGFAAIVIIFSSLNPLSAATSSTDNILNQILQVVNTISNTTTSILTTVNTIPAGIGNIATLILNIVNGDNSKETANLQATFTTLSNTLQTYTNVNPLVSQLNSILFPNAKTPANQAELVYSNLLNPNSTYTPQYLGHASGVEISHFSPDGLSFKSDSSKQSYLSYYNAVMAITSFNAYVLGSAGTTENNLNQAQQSLLTQAGGADWFQTVATDPIGYILRRILMFQSQQFLFFNELLKTQKQLLYAQAMTNTLLINLGRSDEFLLLKNSVK